MVVGLVPPTTGEVFIDAMPMHGRGRRAERRRLRRRIQMVFQDPYASLNPRWRALDIIAEPIRAFHLAAARAEIASRVGELLRLVGLDPADGGKYPHQFSGGQRQRIAIARALASQPAIHRVRRADLGARRLGPGADPQLDARPAAPVRPHLSLHQPQSRGGAPHGPPDRRDASRPAGRDRRGGRIFPRAAPSLYAHAARCRPDLDMSGRQRKPVEGEVPNPVDPPEGCSFHPRCPFANARCRVERPRLMTRGLSAVSCHAVEEGRI